jgi:cytidylate kinase
VSPPDRFVVTIDGPAASGKSSTAQWVAQELGFRHVDSGALYRAATAAVLRRVPTRGAEAPEGADDPRWGEPEVLTAVGAVTVVPAATSVEPRIDGAGVEGELRGAAVTAHVSRVAQMSGVRAWVNAQVRAVADAGPVVCDGRDMGTAVFPDAPLKVFLVADPRERARRRLRQRWGREPTRAEVDAETTALVARDARDAAQTQPAADAVRLDTTALTQADQVARIVEMVRAKLRG